MVFVTSKSLLVLPDNVPVTPQSMTPRSSAVVTSPNGIVTVVAPSPPMRSAIEAVNTRTFMPLRSATDLIGLAHHRTCGGEGKSISSRAP